MLSSLVAGVKVVFDQEHWTVTDDKVKAALVSLAMSGLAAAVTPSHSLATLAQRSNVRNQHMTLASYVPVQRRARTY